MPPALPALPNTDTHIRQHGAIADVVEAARAGAYDFREKPLSRDRLLLTLKNALEQSALRRENERLRDEIAQGKLLRVLQEGEFQRVSGEQPLRVAVTVMSATNRDLADRVARKQFREDLYYRLCVVPIRVPPLRERTALHKRLRALGLTRM